MAQVKIELCYFSVFATEAHKATVHFSNKICQMYSRLTFGTLCCFGLDLRMVGGRVTWVGGGRVGGLYWKATNWCSPLGIVVFLSARQTLNKNEVFLFLTMG